MSKVLFAVTALCLLSGCSPQERPNGPPPPPPKDTLIEEVTFEGGDGWLLHGTLYSPKGKTNLPAVICHPMLSRDRTTYQPLIDQLICNGVLVLAYDPRGHGKSLTGADGKERPAYDKHLDDKPGDKEFWAGLVGDLAKAKAFLIKEHGADPKRIALVGASIGANAALLLAAKDPDVAAVALLSPGANYKGLATFDAAVQLTHPLYVMMGDKDERSGEDPKTIFEKATKLVAQDKVLKRFDGKEHGTNLFSASPGAATELSDWLWKNLADKGPER